MSSPYCFVIWYKCTRAILLETWASSSNIQTVNSNEYDAGAPSHIAIDDFLNTFTFCNRAHQYISRVKVFYKENYHHTRSTHLLFCRNGLNMVFPVLVVEIVHGICVTYNLVPVGIDLLTLEIREVYKMGENIFTMVLQQWKVLIIAWLLVKVQ